MSRAIDAKSAKARATEAARLLRTIKPWPTGFGLGRSFEDCFEMGDGDEVRRLLILKAAADPSLLDAMRAHKDKVGHWIKDVEAILSLHLK